MKNISLLVFISALFITGSSNAEIYKWRDKDGNLHFGDKPPVEAKSQKVKLRVNTYEDVQVFDREAWTEDRKKKSSAKRVVMYSTQWCGVCKKAKNYFAKNKIPYTSYDIENNKKAQMDFKAMGATGVPVILIGNKKMLGFSPGRFQKLYAAK